MLIEIPDHYRDSLAVAMVHEAASRVVEDTYVAARTHQYADMWARGINYGTADTFWDCVIVVLTMSGMQAYVGIVEREKR